MAKGVTTGKQPTDVKSPPGTCKHIRREFGMEVCGICDYLVCPECGIEYIGQDSGSVCWMCLTLMQYRKRVADMEHDQAERKAKYQKATA